jgi:serine/threonine protein kinase
VHRDIKAQNILVSLSDPSKVLLVDFGISRLFRTGVPSQYNPLKESRHVVGTLHWASLNAHDGIGKTCIPKKNHFRVSPFVDLSPRDDLESLAYVSLFLLRGDLPWREPSRSEPVKSSMVRIRAVKAVATGAALATNFPPEFGELLDYSRELKFAQSPDYDDLQARFRRLAEHLGCEPDDPLDWTPSNVTQAVVSSFVPTQSLHTAEAVEEEEDEDDDSAECFSHSYFGWDVSEWDNMQRRNRDPDLTFPEGQAQIWDSAVPEIFQVDM